MSIWKGGIESPSFVVWNASFRLTRRIDYLNSKKIGNDMALAWPSAEIAVMGAKGAVEILHRRNTPEERLELEAGYEERLLNPYIAAERGTIDAVIEPADTRAQVAAAFEMLAGKRERLPRRRHDNTPL